MSNVIGALLLVAVLWFFIGAIKNASKQRRR